MTMMPVMAAMVRRCIGRNHGPNQNNERNGGKKQRA
jgi:hypothetical protein